jgi:ribonuclease E
MPTPERAFAEQAPPVAPPAFEPARPAPIPVEAQPAAERPPERRAPPPPPPIDVDSALRASGLVMIETSRDKVQSTAPVEEVQVQRARRERRPPPPDLDTPLQQVETRKGDGESPPH